MRFWAEFVLVGVRRLLEVEEQKRRAEEDKLAAITELQTKSMEFMKEKSEKRKLGNHPHPDYSQAY